MNIKARVFVLLACGLGAVTAADRYSHCSNYAEYNTLVNLIQHDECMNIDSVFTLLADMTTKEHTGLCRTHAITLLSHHFGSHTRTPDNCHCQGTNRLQQYHTGSGDGVTEKKQTCLQHDSNYKKLYNQFFESGQHHDVPACRTHHSYAFDNHADTCSCSNNMSSQHNTGHQGHVSVNDRCLRYSSFVVHHPDYISSFDSAPNTKPNNNPSTFAKMGMSETIGNIFRLLLQRLGDTDGCLSANSVWHYLDDLQVRDPSCRELIQQHLADKYKHATSQATNDCVCKARRHLVNHAVHRMKIEALLFSNIVAHGCQNHNQLWNKLERIRDDCDGFFHLTHCTDCTEDMIVRAAIQYPTDSSDSCVCSEAMTTTTTKRTTTRPTTLSTTTAAPSTTTTTTPATFPAVKYTCNKLAVVQNVAMSLHTTHPDSSPCTQHVGSFDDAYVLNMCNTSSPSTWHAGANVMADCESSTHSIPPFTPISTFSGGRYVPDGAGIFLECQNNQIKMAVQKCNGVPEIIHIDTGVLVNNQHNFYVIA